MPIPLRLILALAFAALPTTLVWADKQTVCTITVNSADEKEAFRRHLPASKYQFVELVEPNRPDWLASSCQKAIACDVLIISGHYDGGNEFFSDRLESREFLPVAELERVSCSDSCPGLFARLKEVYLFGCNTLNPQPLSSASAEVVRSLLREGHSRGDAERALKSLNAGHGESSRDRMRLVFKDVPVIYGFSSVAPLGPVAASTLGRYFQANGARDVGTGRTSSRLLSHFATQSMTASQGMTDADPHADMRRDVCRFADDRPSAADKVQFVHQILGGQMAQARVFLDRIQRTTAALDDGTRQTPQVAMALDAITRDSAVRQRYLTFARDADEPVVRARMVNLAHDLGWLSTDERLNELANMFGQRLAQGAVGTTEIDLACGLNPAHEIDAAFERLWAPQNKPDDVARAAVRACLGSAEGLARTMQALLSPVDADVRLAQTYLRHRPISDVGDLRQLAAGIAAMPASEAQVRALETLGRHYLSDRRILDSLTRLYTETSSWPVQAAIAGILIRADKRSIGSAELVQTLKEKRRQSPPGDNMVDALIRNLQAS